MNKKVALLAFSVLGITTAFGLRLIKEDFGESKKGFITQEGKSLIEERLKKTTWWHRWAVFKPLKVSEKKRKKWQDTRGLGFWEVKNNGAVPVFVSSDIQKSAIIAPGGKMHIHRGNKFWLVFTAKIDQFLPGKERPIKREYKERLTTENHYIDVSTPYRGKRTVEGERRRVLKVESRE